MWPGRRPPTVAAETPPGAPGVHVGRDGWLFWTGPSGEVTRLYSDTIATRWLVWRWRRLIEARARRCARRGIAYLQVIAPDKLSLLGESFGPAGLDAGLSPARRIGRALPPDLARRVWIDLPAAFARRGLDPETLLVPSDTHFNGQGYLEAYRTICAACGATPAATVEQGHAAPMSLVLDLGGKIRPNVPDTLWRHEFAPRARRVEANALVRLREGRLPETWGNLMRGSRVVYRLDAPEADPRTVVLFGDSYAFMDYTLAPMLAETFRELHVIWSSEIDWEYVGAVRPALVIHELAERFVRRVPRDRFRVERYAAERARAAAAA